MPKIKYSPRYPLFTHLLFGDIDRLINYYPDGALPAAGVRGGALVGDVVIRVGQQGPHGYVPDGRGEAFGEREEVQKSKVRKQASA